MTALRPFVRPRRLRAGDRVALLTLASPSRDTDVEAGADELRALGFEPVVMAPPAHITASGAPYVAGAPDARATQLRSALADPDVRAVIAVRGGYGSAQLLPFLDIDDLRASRTLVIGYSDITALLDVATGHAGLVSIHGPMAEGRLARGPDAYDRDSFLRLTMDPVAFGRVDTTGARIIRPGDTAGVLRGGTLTQLAALLGTPWAFTAAERTVLFVDEVNERPYRLDRLLWQLRAAGVLAHVTGIVFNELPGCDEPGGALTALDAVRSGLEGFVGPIVAGVASGHTARPMLSLPFGVRVTLAAADDVVLSIDESAVE